MTEAEELELLELEELEAQSATPKQEPSKSRAAIIAGTQGLTSGWADNIGGAIGQFFVPESGVKPGAAAQPTPDDSPEIAAAKTQLNTKGPSSYELIQQGMSAEAKAAEAAHPGIYNTFETGGQILQSLVPVAKGAGVAAKIGKVATNPAVTGALNAWGNAEGSFGEQALQTAGGAVLGKVVDKTFKGAGNALKGARKFVGGKKFESLAQKFKRVGGEAVGDQVEAATAGVVKRVKSGVGAYRGKVQEAARDLEVIEREARDGVGKAADEAREFLKTPDAQALREMVLENKLISAPERIADVKKLKAAADELISGQDDAIAQEIAEKSANPIKSVVTPRLKAHLVNKGLPVAATAAGSTVGNMLGGEDHDTLGTALGGGVGFGLSLFGGNPGTVIKNVAKNPYLREYVAKGGQKVAEGAGTLVDGLTRPAILEATDDVDEKYRALAEFLNRSRRE